MRGNLDYSVMEMSPVTNAGSLSPCGNISNTYLRPQWNVFSFCNFRAKGILGLIAAVGRVCPLVSGLRHILQGSINAASSKLAQLIQ